MLISLVLTTAFAFADAFRSYQVQYGGGEISITLDSSIPGIYRSYVLQLFDDVYPRLKFYFGAPGKSSMVRVAYDPSIKEKVGCGGIYSGNIFMATLPFECSGPGRHDPIFDSVFTHELAHAFQLGAISLSSWTEYGEPGLWSIEGMASVAEWLVRIDLQRNGIRDFDLGGIASALKRFDSFNFLGLDTIGGWFNYGKRDLLNLDLYSQSAAMLYVMTTALAQYSGDTTFLARLNNAIYSEATSACNAGQPHCNVFDDFRILSIIREIAEGSLIDGMTADQWLSLQAVTFQPGNLGPRLGVYFEDPGNPRTIVVFSFVRLKSEGEISEVPIPGLQVSMFWRHSAGTPDFTVVTGQDGTARFSLPDSLFTDSGRLPYGGYVVYARANWGGTDLVSRNYGFSIGKAGPPPAPSEETRTFGVLLDAIAIPSYFDLTASGTGGTNLLYNMGGAFVIDSPTPEAPAEIVVTSVYNGVEHRQVYSKPNPFTRVVWKLGGAQLDFQLTVSPSFQQVVAGASTQFTIALTGAGTLGLWVIEAYPISLAVRGTTYWIASIEPYMAISFNRQYMLIVTTVPETPPASYDLTVLASSGALQHTQTISVVVTTNVSTSTATVSTYTVSFYADPPSGTMAADGIIMLNGASGTYAANQRVHVVANPPNGYSFSHWETGGIPVDSPFSRDTYVTVSNNGWLKAYFSTGQQPTSLTILFSPEVVDLGTIPPGTVTIRVFLTPPLSDRTLWVYQSKGSDQGPWKLIGTCQTDGSGQCVLSWQPSEFGWDYFLRAYFEGDSSYLSSTVTSPNPVTAVPEFLNSAALEVIAVVLLFSLLSIFGLAL
jgi:hypothetical protein